VRSEVIQLKGGSYSYWLPDITLRELEN
jgi:hypothetical protein